MEIVEEIEGKMRVPRDILGARKTPLEILRTQTNIRFLVSIAIYLILWIGIAIFADCSIKFHKSINFRSGFVAESFISNARWIVIKFSAFTAVMSFSYIILLKRFARVLVFATISGFCIILIAAMCIFFFFYLQKNQYELYLVGFIVSTLAVIPTVGTIIILRENIPNTVEVMRVVSKIVISFPSSLFFPIISCVLYGIVISFSLVTWNSLLKDFSHHNNDYFFFFGTINIFGFLWMVLFVTGWSQTVLSAMFCTWYWAMYKINITRYRTILSYAAIITGYHLGTIACGSLMIILRKLITLLLHTFGRVYILFGCYTPLFGKIEKYMLTINHNAYIITSSYGTGFFQSAKDASIVTKNFATTPVMCRIVEAIMIIAQILIITTSAAATYGYCQYTSETFDTTLEAVLMVILTGIIITTSIFMVPKIAIDSIFFCVMEDDVENTEKHYYMGTNMKSLFLQNSPKM